MAAIEVQEGAVAGLEAVAARQRERDRVEAGMRDLRDRTQRAVGQALERTRAGMSPPLPLPGRTKTTGALSHGGDTGRIHR